MSEPVRARLVADAGVSAVVQQRVYAHEVPQGVSYPCITFEHISTGEQQTLGAYQSRRRERWQIDVWSKSALERKSLADAVQAAMEAEGTDFRAVRLDRSGEFISEISLYRATLEYSISLQE